MPILRVAGCWCKMSRLQTLTQGLKNVFYSTAEFEDTNGRSFSEWVEFIAEQGNEDAQRLISRYEEYKMSFKITNTNGVYLIDIGTGTRYCANDLQAVVYALQHYFRESIPMYPFEYHSHVKHNKECNCCPLCDNK
jgi:hypothetical protein